MKLHDDILGGLVKQTPVNYDCSTTHSQEGILIHHLYGWIKFRHLNLLSQS